MELAESDTGRSMLRFLALAAGEGAEEVVSDLLSPLAEATYRDESLGELYRQLEPEDLLFFFMIGAAISTLATGASTATRQIRISSMTRLPGGDAQVNPLRHNKQGIINESLPGRGIKISLLFMSVNPSPRAVFWG